jgi:hypothetical protein
MQSAYRALADEENVRYVGEDAGLASKLKVLSNYLLMSGIATLAEAVATAQAAGLGDDLIRDYFGQFPTIATAVRNRLGDIISGPHVGWFPTRLGVKDVRLAEELAGSNGVRLPLAEAVRHRYEQAAAAGWREADVAAVVEVLRGRAVPPGTWATSVGIGGGWAQRSHADTSAPTSASRPVTGGLASVKTTCSDTMDTTQVSGSANLSSSGRMRPT